MFFSFIYSKINEKLKKIVFIIFKYIIFLLYIVIIINMWTFTEQLVGHVDSIINGALTGLGVLISSTLWQVLIFGLSVVFLLWVKKLASNR